MKRQKLWDLFACLALCAATSSVWAETVETPTETDAVKTTDSPSLNASQADWVFSGAVTNESGERFNYYFQMQRKGMQFHALATLIDGQNKNVLLFEDARATIEQPQGSNWQVGQAFMEFNPINNSWVFGVKTKNKQGFNFKVDMLSQAANLPHAQDLRSGLELLVNQTGRLNGHLQTGDLNREQFVTAPKAWFRQLWVTKPQETLHPFLGVLCQFNDGSGFYSVNLQESDALRGSVAGWRDEQGLPVSMSQFVSVKEEKEGVWQIHIPSPKVHLSLDNALQEKDKHSLIAGLTQGLKAGFCTISNDKIGKEEELPEPVDKQETTKKASILGFAPKLFSLVGKRSG